MQTLIECIVIVGMVNNRSKYFFYNTSTTVEAFSCCDVRLVHPTERWTDPFGVRREHTHTTQTYTNDLFGGARSSSSFIVDLLPTRPNRFMLYFFIWSTSSGETWEDYGSVVKVCFLKVQVWGSAGRVEQRCLPQSFERPNSVVAVTTTKTLLIRKTAIQANKPAKT